jgi:hypothetical protein
MYLTTAYYEVNNNELTDLTELTDFNLNTSIVL